MQSDVEVIFFHCNYSTTAAYLAVKHSAGAAGIDEGDPAGLKVELLVAVANGNQWGANELRKFKESTDGGGRE